MLLRLCRLVSSHPVTAPLIRFTIIVLYEFLYRTVYMSMYDHIENSNEKQSVFETIAT